MRQEVPLIAPRSQDQRAQVLDRPQVTELRLQVLDQVRLLDQRQVADQVIARTALLVHREVLLIVRAQVLDQVQVIVRATEQEVLHDQRAIQVIILATRQAIALAQAIQVQAAVQAIQGAVAVRAIQEVVVEAVVQVAPLRLEDNSRGNSNRHFKR